VREGTLRRRNRKKRESGGRDKNIEREREREREREKCYSGGRCRGSDARPHLWNMD